MSGHTRENRRRAKAALVLRTQGQDFDDIATMLGYKNARAAQTAVEFLLGQQATDEDRDIHRELVGARIETLLAGLWPKATNPEHPEHINAVRAARELIDRHARLYGLDRQENRPSTVTDDVLLRWVSDVLSYTSTTVIEADVVNGDDDDDEQQAARELTAG